MTEATGFMSIDSALAGFRPVNTFALQSSNGTRQKAIRDVVFNCTHAVDVLESLRPPDKLSQAEWEEARATIIQERIWWEAQLGRERSVCYNLLFAERYEGFKLAIQLALGVVDPDLSEGFKSEFHAR